MLGALQIWHLAVAAAALGIAAAFFFPAYSAILPRILPAEQLLAANGVEGVVRPVFQRSVGPAVAGLVVGATFPSVGAVVVAGLFGLGLLLLWSRRARRPGRRGVRIGEKPRMLRDLRDGFVFMVATPWLLWTLLFASLFVLVVLGPIEVLLPFIAHTASPTAPGCTASCWRSSGWAARSARSRCPRGACRGATSP